MEAKKIGVVLGVLLLAGCSVRVNKGGNGENKDVRVNTPFGHVQVHKDATARRRSAYLPIRAQSLRPAKAGTTTQRM